MMEFGHFILVTVKLDCRIANDGNVCCAAPTRVILHSVSLRCIPLFGILHYEYRREEKWGELIYACSHLSGKFMEKKLRSRKNVFLLSQVTVPLRSRWQLADTAKAETMTLTGSRPIPGRNPHRTHGCPQVKTMTPDWGVWLRCCL